MKPVKKILSICLAALMLLSVSGVAFAAEDGKQDCPVVHVPGFYSSDIYADVNDTDTLITFPDTDSIIELVKMVVIPSLIIYCADRDIDKLSTNISSEIKVLFADWFYESTGEPQENSGIIFDEAPEGLTAESKLIFRFDWRNDPVAIADSLASYIDNAITVSGCDKVALSAHSFGSNIVTAYLQKYGNSKISSVLFDSPACYGVAVVGNLLTGKVTFDSEAIAYFLKTALGENEYESLLSSIIDIFEMAEIPELFTLFIDEVIEALAPGVYKEIFAPLFGYWPAMWAMVPDAQLDEAMSYIFDGVLEGQDTAALKEKIASYNAVVRDNREVVLKDFDSVGNFAVLSRFGAPSFPLSSAADLLGDTVIETKSSSLGALTAPVGDYFSDEEINGVAAEYISPDRTVNASTCLFPEKTWFIKGTGHFETELTEPYYDYFLFAAEELTCGKTDFGRFCTFDKETLALVKDTSEPQKIKKPSAFERLFNFLKALFERIGAFFKNIFSK